MEERRGGGEEEDRQGGQQGMGEFRSGPVPPPPGLKQLMTAV